MKKIYAVVFAISFLGVNYRVIASNKHYLDSEDKEILNVKQKEIFKLISGKVLDGDSNNGVPGVSVVLKGSTIGTLTDAEGRYELKISVESGILVFSSIGYETQEISLGSQSILDVNLTESSKALSEVVVTALGFKEKADRLGSTSSKVAGDQIVKSGESSFINGLAGKASGVQISRAAGDPGAASFIQIRGQNTLTGNSQPLVVVDGVPISSTTEGGSSGGVVPQSRLNDINPNDIESMQILKGASAAALWGSRAANGVIIITTKKGSDEGKMAVSFSSTLSMDKINKYHPFQNTFGQGSRGAANPNTSLSWGDKIADRSSEPDEVDTSGGYFEAEDGTLYYPILTKNSTETFNKSNFNEVFRTGTYLDNSLSISGGDKKGTFFFSMGDVRQKGIQQGNSNYSRTSIRLNTERQFTDELKLSVNASYVKSFSDRIQRGNNLSGGMVGLARNSPDFDISDYKGSYYSSALASPIENRQRGYRSYLGARANPPNNNALWALYEQTNSTDVDRFINSVELNYEPVKWLNLIARTGIDTYTDDQISYFPVNDIRGAGNGSYNDQITKEKQFNTDILARISGNLSSDLFSTLIVGANYNSQDYYNIGATISNFLIADAPPNFSNAVATNKNPVNTRRTVKTARAYATTNLGYKDYLFLNLSAAAESASTFGKLADKTFYYPSADVAWLFTNHDFAKSVPFLNFGKLRASFGIVGVQPLPYLSNTIYSSTSFSASPFGDFLVGSQFGNGAFNQGSSLGDQNLRPERKTEYEVGIDLRLLRSKLKVSATYYSNKVEDVLVPVTLAPTTGFSTKYTNAASLQNEGFEMELGYDILQKGNFEWNLNANFTRNRSLVLDLAGTQSLFLQGGINNFFDARAVVGEPVGVFWSSKYAVDDEGKRVLDANGFPTANPVTGVVGDPNPDWIGGLGTSLKWKNLSLNMLFETSQGADYFNGTRGVMGTFGTHAITGNEVTLTQDTKNYVGQVIPAGSTVRGNIEDFGAGNVLLDQSWYTTLGSGFGSLKEQFVDDGSWTRLRQLSMSYALNSAKFRAKTKLQSVEFTLTGRNLLLWTKMIGIDPDTNISGVPAGRNMDYFNSPGTQSFIFSLRVNY